MPFTLKHFTNTGIFLLLATFTWPSLADSTCADLLHLKLSNADIVLAEHVSAGIFTAPDGNAYDVPTFCRVHGVARPTGDSEINFEVWLPAENWNGRYYQNGIGGFAGRIGYNGLAESIKQGNAVAATDMGHTEEGASWALGHPEKIIDYGYRGLKVTTDHSKLVLSAYYGKPAIYSYFAGCSSGGSQALMVAQRYPEDWDGILAGAPANFLTLESTMQAENEVMQWSTPGYDIPHAKLPAIQKAALASCQSDAHLIDGVAADPRFCQFDPASLLCEEGADSNACLTSNQVDTLKKIYKGLVNPDTGELLYPGYEATFEADLWPNVIIGERRGQTPGYHFGSELLSKMVTDNPDLDIYSMDIKDVLPQLYKKTVSGKLLREVLDFDNPDLRKLHDQGGKLIVYHGWGDGLPTPRGSVHYYQDVMKLMKSSHDIDSFYRLFMVPGMGHCGYGPGANAFGQLSITPGLKNDREHNVYRALEAWVERGVAPEKIIATKYIDDKPEKGVSFTRPLCLYPKLPVYDGGGDIKKAKNFSCKLGETL